MAETRLKVKKVGDVRVVHFLDQKLIEDIVIHDWGVQLYRLIEEEKDKKILLNFTGLQFMSSSALGKLITLNKKANQQGAKIVLCSIPQDILEVFQITHLDRVFTIAKNESEGLNALQD
jgi:anti-sigma B factor antagonist